MNAHFGGGCPELKTCSVKQGLTDLSQMAMFIFVLFKIHSSTFPLCEDRHKLDLKRDPRCIRGGETLSSTYSCLAVR